MATTRASAEIRRAVMARARNICPHKRRLRARVLAPIKFATAWSRCQAAAGRSRASRFVCTAHLDSPAPSPVWLTRRLISAARPRAGGWCLWCAPRGASSSRLLRCGRQLDALNEKGFTDYAKLVFVLGKRICAPCSDCVSHVAVRTRTGCSLLARVATCRAGALVSLLALTSSASSKFAAHLPRGCARGLLPSAHGHHSDAPEWP
ncbi:hypothetical protein MRX96_030934 [Rhipicephalus microplus]